MLRRKDEREAAEMLAAEAFLAKQAPEPLTGMEREYLRRRVFDNLGPQVQPPRPSPVRLASRWPGLPAAIAAAALLVAVALPLAGGVMDKSRPDLAHADVISGQLVATDGPDHVVREGVRARAIGATAVLLMEEGVRLDLSDGAVFTFYEGTRLDVQLDAGEMVVTTAAIPVVVSGGSWQARSTSDGKMSVIVDADGATVTVGEGGVAVGVPGMTCTAEAGQSVVVAGGACSTVETSAP